MGNQWFTMVSPKRIPYFRSERSSKFEKYIKKNPKKFIQLPKHASIHDKLTNSSQKTFSKEGSIHYFRPSLRYLTSSFKRSQHIWIWLFNFQGCKSVYWYERLNSLSCPRCGIVNLCKSQHQYFMVTQKPNQEAPYGTSLIGPTSQSSLDAHTFPTTWFSPSTSSSLL